MSLYECPECESSDVERVREMTPVRTNPSHEAKGGGLLLECGDCGERFSI